MFTVHSHEPISESLVVKIAGIMADVAHALDKKTKGH
jgi:hypothetical protein